MINQHFTYRVSFKKIVDILLETFNIQIHHSRISIFKERFAEEYKITYERLKQEIIHGNLLHVDETPVEFSSSSSGYIWVFANIDAVFYLFRPNREADFLKDLLKEFNGVLISDFYPGYDSLPCPQQKCFVHLIRDLNNDFHKNQLNDEFKAIVIAFGKLLRIIVETIDKYGLKKWHLNKHIKDVERFYREVVNKEYESDIAISWQKRFIKNKDKLFTFLSYDSVPWNNNNAEVAIKTFADFRRIGKYTFTQKAINEYLVLFSIQQTCKYKGLSFLEFLKSGEKSIEAYTRKVLG